MAQWTYADKLFNVLKLPVALGFYYVEKIPNRPGRYLVTLRDDENNLLRFIGVRKGDAAAKQAAEEDDET